METTRIQLCIDGSRASMVAARSAIDLALLWHSRLRAVYVVETGDGSPAGAPGPAMRESGRAALGRVRAMAVERGVEVETEVLEGIPFEAILRDAREWKADIIVMGRTGRMGAARVLLGSEAERVLEFTDRPVLIVPSTEAVTY